MTVTLIDLRARVNAELQNGAVRGSFTIEADGLRDAYVIAPVNRTVLDDADFAVYVDEALDNTGVMNYTNGVFTFASVLTAGQVIRCEFNYVYWVDGIVDEAINAAIGSLFPAFWVSTVENIVTDGEAYEYTLATPNVALVSEMSISTTGLAPWSAQSSKKRTAHRSADNYVVRFYSPPAEGTARAILVCRPLFLTEDTDALDIPDRAAAPIISYAAYYLLTQKMVQRVRSDVAVNTTGQGSLSPRQMNDVGNTFYLRYQTQLMSTKMFPWSVY